MKCSAMRNKRGEEVTERCPECAGLKDGERIVCPIFNNWISEIRCLEIRLSRSMYEECKENEEYELERPSQTIKNAVITSGRVFPEQVREVVSICRFCEENCLGK